MHISLSTHWNAGRHERGETIVDEALDLGFSSVELGYNLHSFHLPGIRSKVSSGEITVSSVHNFCPVPSEAGIGHPEIYTLADPSASIRRKAVDNISTTVRLAGELGARVVVMHCGNLSMHNYSQDLKKLHLAGKRYTDKYERLKMKAILKREKKVRRQLEYLFAGLETLLPVLQEAKVVLGYEVLPTWEAIPNEIEIQMIARHFRSEHIRFWHDTGHGQIRENLGFSNHFSFLESVGGILCGMHVHDVAPPTEDHVMPPHGSIDFKRFARLARPELPCVLEPAPSTSSARVAAGARFIEECWFPTPESKPPDH